MTESATVAKYQRCPNGSRTAAWRNPSNQSDGSARLDAPAASARAYAASASSTGTVNDACVGAPGSGATESGGNASATVNVLVPPGRRAAGRSG